MARCQDPRHEPIAVRNRGGWFGGQAIDAGTTTSRTGVGFNCFPVYLRSIIVDQPQGYAVYPYRGNGDIGACHWGLGWIFLWQAKQTRELARQMGTLR
jgi:hypothetical protein